MEEDERLELGSLPELLTTREVAELLHIHPNTVRKWYKQGILKGYRIGPRGDRRFPKEEIQRLLVVQLSAVK